MKFEKRKDELGYYDINLIKDRKKFKIFFGGNGDLYWELFPKILFDEEIKLPEEIIETFEVSKDDDYIYEVFDELYTRIKECNVFSKNKLGLENYGLKEDSLTEEEKKLVVESAKEHLRKTSRHSDLFNNEVVSWHTENALYEEGNIVNIYKKTDKYLIEFKYNKKSIDELDFSIRFCNSGSTYQPFNLVFMNAYNELCEYEPNNNKKLEKKMN